MREGTNPTISTPVTEASILLVPVADSVFVLFGATLLFRFGTGLYGAQVTAIFDISTDQVGAATGVTLAAEDGGQSLLASLAGFLAVTLAWQMGFGLTVPLFLFATVGRWRTIPARTSAPGVPSSSPRSGALDTSSPNSAGLGSWHGAALLLLGNSI